MKKRNRTSFKTIEESESKKRFDEKVEEMLDEGWEIAGTGFGTHPRGENIYVGYFKKDIPVLYTSEILPDILRGLKEKTFVLVPFANNCNRLRVKFKGHTAPHKAAADGYVVFEANKINCNPSENRIYYCKRADVPLFKIAADHTNFQFVRNGEELILAVHEALVKQDKLIYDTETFKQSDAYIIDDIKK